MTLMHHDIRAYYHHRVLKKCYVLCPIAAFDIRHQTLVQGRKYIGLRQKQNTFAIDHMRALVDQFLNDNPSWTTLTVGKSMKGLLVPEGLVLTTLKPSKVLESWEGYGEWQTFNV